MSTKLTKEQEVQLYLLIEEAKHEKPLTKTKHNALIKKVLNA